MSTRNKKQPMIIAKPVWKWYERSEKGVLQNVDDYLYISGEMYPNPETAVEKMKEALTDFLFKYDGVQKYVLVQEWIFEYDIKDPI